MEKNNKLGKKLLATGNGRCNIMNWGAPVYFGDAAFVEKVLSFCPPDSVRRFLEGLGLVLRQEEGGRIYPAGNRADMVLDAFTEPLNNSSVQVLLSTEAIGLQQIEKGWQVQTQTGESYTASHLILAGGGCAAPKLGGTDSMYRLLSEQGFTLVPPWPALCALETDKGPLRGLSGLRLLARAAGRGLKEGKNMEVSLDFSPTLGLCDAVMERKTPEAPDANLDKVRQWLAERQSYLAPHRLLSGALPKALADKMLGKTLEQTARNLCDWRLRVKGVRGFDHAQVAAGGISTKGINPQTMETSLPRLYLCGELLNVDGDTGGHNLMFALATGILAGESIAPERK